MNQIVNNKSVDNSVFLDNAFSISDDCIITCDPKIKKQGINQPLTLLF